LQTKEFVLDSSFQSLDHRLKDVGSRPANLGQSDDIVIINDSELALASDKGGQNA